MTLGSTESPEHGASTEPLTADLIPPDLRFAAEHVPGVGFEPTRSSDQPILSRPRLALFRHPGSFRIRGSPASVSAPVGIRLGMAVRAEKPQIAEPVVVPPAVDVVEFKGDR